MALRIKTKVFFGLTFLFVLVILMGGIGAYSIYTIADESKEVLKDNYESVEHARQMLELLDVMTPSGRQTQNEFAAILKKQEQNITEAGEKKITEGIRSAFVKYFRTGNPEALVFMRSELYKIMDLNMNAITLKNTKVQDKSLQMLSYLALTGMFCLLLSLSFIFNFPSYIATPIINLTAGIKQIANKNYAQRLHFQSEDEFGELANAFNSMAEHLNEYENSNLAEIMFEKKRIETIINQMNDAIIGFDKKKNILFVNSVAEQLLGMKETEIRNFPSEKIAAKNELMKKILDEKGLADLVIRTGKKDNFFRKESFNVMSGTEQIGEVILLKNITLHKELDLAKTHFIATVSHELKTPISSIKISSDLLEDVRIGETNEEQKQLIKNIRDDADRLLKITAELLDRTQAETGKIQLQIQKTKPEEIVEYAVAAVSSQAEQKKISFELLYSERDIVLDADKEKTAWVLVNLLSNAIRYSPDYGKIIVEVKEKENKVEFSVKDFGKGIDPKYKDKIFDRYFRVPDGAKSGTGLGLTISKEFIEAQGGTIRMESEAGSGCRFVFSI